jgi:hypothetical protein
VWLIAAARGSLRSLQKVVDLVKPFIVQSCVVVVTHVAYQRASMNFRLRRSRNMDDTTYTKGLYTATISVRPVDDGQYQGLVSLARDDGEETDSTFYEVGASSENEGEALEEARALAHRILGEIEL